MIIKESNLRKYIKKLLKEDKDEPVVEINNQTSFDISKQIDSIKKKFEKITTVEQIISLLTQISQVFKTEIKDKIPKDSISKKVLFSSSFCTPCKIQYKLHNQEIIYIIVYNEESENINNIDYNLYNLLHNAFSKKWKETFTLSNVNDDKYLFSETPVKQEEYESKRFIEDWRQILQLCSFLKSAVGVYKDKIESIGFGFPQYFESFDAIMQGFDNAISNLQKISNKPKTTLKEIKIKISRALNQIYNHNKNYEEFFGMLKKLAAQYSENNNVENIIEIFEKTLLNSLIKDNKKPMEEKFYNINSYVFQHRNESECTDWIKFISWAVKRYKEM